MSLFWVYYVHVSQTNIAATVSHSNPSSTKSMQSAFISFISHQNTPPHSSHFTEGSQFYFCSTNYGLFIMSGLTLFNPQPENVSIANASAVCIRPEDREGGSGLCRHIKATSVRYANMPCRTSLFTATPGWMLKPSAVLYILCAEIFVFGGISPSFIQAVKCVRAHKWEVLLKEMIVIAAMQLITAPRGYYFRLSSLI